MELFRVLSSRCVRSKAYDAGRYLFTKKSTHGVRVTLMLELHEGKAIIEKGTYITFSLRLISYTYIKQVTNILFTFNIYIYIL